MGMSSVSSLTGSHRWKIETFGSKFQLN